MLNQSSSSKDVRCTGGVYPCFHNVNTRFRWMVLINEHVLKTYGVVEVYTRAFIMLTLNAGKWWFTTQLPFSQGNAVGSYWVKRA